jgi:hypothetical protein
MLISEVLLLKLKKPYAFIIVISVFSQDVENFSQKQVLAKRKRKIWSGFG